jgi:hypothetical protein
MIETIIINLTKKTKKQLIDIIYTLQKQNKKLTLKTDYFNNYIKTASIKTQGVNSDNKTLVLLEDVSYLIEMANNYQETV